MTHTGRLRGERGTAMITVTVLLFALTGGAIIWLSRDVNRQVANRSAAMSVAFQAARTGAQQIDDSTLRGGGVEPAVHAERAAQRAGETAIELMAANGLILVSAHEQIDVRISSDRQTVTVELMLHDDDGGASVTASAQAERG